MSPSMFGTNLIDSTFGMLTCVTMRPLETATDESVWLAASHAMRLVPTRAITLPGALLFQRTSPSGFSFGIGLKLTRPSPGICRNSPSAMRTGGLVSAACVKYCHSTRPLDRSNAQRLWSMLATKHAWLSAAIGASTPAESLRVQRMPALAASMAITVPFVLPASASSPVIVTGAVTWPPSVVERQL